jgi:hypothetical protein
MALHSDSVNESNWEAFMCERQFAFHADHLGHVIAPLPMTGNDWESKAWCVWFRHGGNHAIRNIGEIAIAAYKVSGKFLSYENNPVPKEPRHDRCYYCDTDNGPNGAYRDGWDCFMCGSN